MKILVIGSHKTGSVGINNFVLGLSKIGVDFDHYPNILTQSDNFTDAHPPESSYANISYPEYPVIVENLKKRHYDLIITRTCSVNYSGGKHGFLSQVSRRLKYSLVSNKYRMAGTLVTDWIKAGIKLPPFIVFDCLDDVFIWPVDFELLLNCSIYLKRELPFDRFFCFRLFEPKLHEEQKIVLAEKLKPIWLSYDSDLIYTSTDIERVKPYRERDIDISHLCHIHASYNRIKILPLLETLGTKYNVVSTKKGKFSKAKFFELLNRSKIVVSLEGRGWDCPKHYEIMLCGALLFIARPSIELAIDLIDGENCVFIENDLSNFEELARYYLDNPSLSAKIARKGYELARDHLGNDKLAEYVLKTAKQIISGQVRLPNSCRSYAVGCGKQQNGLFK